MFDKQSQRLEASLEKKIQGVTSAFKEEIKSANEMIKNELVEMMDKKIDEKFQGLATDVEMLKANINATQTAHAREAKRARSVEAPVLRRSAGPNGNLIDRALRLTGFPRYFPAESLKNYTKSILGEYEYEKMLVKGQKSDEITIVFNNADDKESFCLEPQGDKQTKPYLPTSGGGHEALVETRGNT